MSNLYTNESPPKQSDKFEFLNLRLLPGKSITGKQDTSSRSSPSPSRDWWRWDI